MAATTIATVIHGNEKAKPARPASTATPAATMMTMFVFGRALVKLFFFFGFLSVEKKNFFQKFTTTIYFL
jgi:hypothetical protein